MADAMTGSVHFISFSIDHTSLLDLANEFYFRCDD